MPFLVALAVLVGATPLVEAAAPPGAWWNGSYLNRQKVTVTAGAAATAPYSISVQLDHATLVDLNQSLASGDDLRVLYPEEGVMPELLAIYHLLADPGMRLE